MRRLWNKISFIGLRDLDKSAAISNYREVVLLNRLVFIFLLVILVYLPLEITLNGIELILPISIQLIGISMSWYWNYKKWYDFSKNYFLLISLAVVLPMLYFIPKDSGNEYFLLPVSLFPTILYSNRVKGAILFCLIVVLFFVSVSTREMVPNIIEVPQDTMNSFEKIFALLVFVGCYLIIFYFKNMSIEYSQTIKTKNKQLEVRNEEVKMQRDEISKHKGLLENKNREITDSINYAQGIQQAILPSFSLLQENLSQSYLLFKPKDIVSGDFYWMERVENSILFAVADCTGHGVPGALVSVVCNNALNRSVREYNLDKPSQILNKTRELVIETFENNKREVMDGMDIALCSLNVEKKELQYAGANNPLWVFTTQSDHIEKQGFITDQRDGKNALISINADKQPIGKYMHMKSFTNHCIKLSKGDSIVIFSDGYADQFGGKKGKKMKPQLFKEYLLASLDLSMDEQKKSLDTMFNKWKGNYEQVDDVCVMGVKI